MVFLPLNGTINGSGGGHSVATDTDPFTADQDTAWIAYMSYGDLPYVTQGFSHEHLIRIAVSRNLDRPFQRS